MMASRRTRLAAWAVWASLPFAAGVAGAEEFVSLDHPAEEELMSQAFRLSAPRTIQVRCVGAGDGGAEDLYAYGWILDLTNHKVVWSLDPDSAQHERRNLVFEGSVSLPAGDYVAYYASYYGWHYGRRIIRFMGKGIGRIEIRDPRRRRPPSDSQHWGLTLSTSVQGDAAIETEMPPSRPDPRAIVEIVGVGDEALEQRGFTLPERMQVEVYCVGEIDPDDDTRMDYGWILDARSRRKVWELDKGNYKYAGGSPSNRYARETITLAAGDYIASYTTDAAHSAADWAGPPPWDPASWGIT